MESIRGHSPHRTFWQSIEGATEAAALAKKFGATSVKVYRLREMEVSIE